MVPSALAGHPSSTSPESVFSTPSASVWNEPVEVIIIGLSPVVVFSDTSVVTGNMPRPEMAMSSALEVETSAPCWSITREVVARTPPAE